MGGKACRYIVSFVATYEDGLIQGAFGSYGQLHFEFRIREVFNFDPEFFVVVESKRAGF